MRIKFVIAVMLAVVCLLLVTAGVGTAQQGDPIKANLDYKVYLPFISKPPCTYTYPPIAYVVVSNPVVRVGEIVTVTGALYNECTPLGNPEYHMFAQPEGILSPSLAITHVLPPFVAYGSYQEFTFAVQAVGEGEVNVVANAVFEVTISPTRAFVSGVDSRPAVMRVLP
jgi:hypothetical protein